MPSLTGPARGHNAAMLRSRLYFPVHDFNSRLIATEANHALLGTDRQGFLQNP